MKGALLLNGRSAIRPTNGGKPFNHDLSRLYAELESFAADLLPSIIAKPEGVDLHWTEETAENFIRRMSREGDAHNRYQIYGFALRPEDLYKFDRMVFAIRRLCCPLDKYLFGNTRSGQPTITNREHLKKRTGYMPNGPMSRFSKLANKGTEQVSGAALNHNLMFAPSDYNHSNVSPRLAAVNPVLFRRLIQPAEQDVSDELATETVDLIDWAIENIFLPEGVKSQISAAKSKLLTKASKSEAEK